MKKKLAKVGISMPVFIGLVILVYGLSWITTCGIIKLVAMCFGWTFKWNIATGIWLILALLSSTFTSHSSK